LQRRKTEFATSTLGHIKNLHGMSFLDIVEVCRLVVVLTVRTDAKPGGFPRVADRHSCEAVDAGSETWVIAYSGRSV
jgi:hypothetical protein